jgi:transposase
MTSYIITEEQLARYHNLVRGITPENLEKLTDSVRSHPYNPQAEPGQRCIHCEVRNDVQFCHYHDVPLQAERDLPHLTSTELLLVAHDEWKCRQERKHYDDEVPWTAGWISGFLTSRKWANEKVAKLRQARMVSSK